MWSSKYVLAMLNSDDIVLLQHTHLELYLWTLYATHDVVTADGEIKWRHGSHLASLPFKGELKLNSLAD